MNTEIRRGAMAPVLTRGMASVALTLFSAMTGVVSVGAAEAPCVGFDVGDVVAARDVTTAEFAELNPDEKLVEVTLHISSLIRFGHDDDLFEYLYVVNSPTRSLRIVDCDPKTEMTTAVTSQVRVRGSNDTRNSWDATAAAGWPTVGDAKIAGQSARQRTQQYEFEMLPPQQLVVASGTAQRGAGAYFKLAPSPRSTLDGARQFGLTLRVPRDWRADYLHVRCAAYVESPRGDSTKRRTCGSAGFVVAVYLEGDGAAKRDAMEFVASERRLRAVANEYRRAIAQRQYPSWTDKLGAALSVADPKIPADWLERALTSAQLQPDLDYVQRLPAPVRKALQDYFAARRQLVRSESPTG